MIDCLTCGYCHLYPFPSPTELEAFYRESYHREKNWPYHKVTPEFLSTQLELAKNSREFQGVYQTVSSLLPAALPRTLLDVGGGNSLLTRYFQDQGWDGLVLEPNRDAAAYLRQFDIEVVEKMAESLDAAELGTFSFINLQFVLEHMMNPLQVLAQFIELLAPDGVLRVCVPNDFSPGQLAWLGKSRQEPPWITYPDHINYFDFASLVRLLSRAGMAEVERSSDFPLEFLLLTGTDYYVDPSMRSKIGPAVRGFEKAWLASGQGDVLNTLYRQFGEMGLGRSAIIYARRA